MGSDSRLIFYSTIHLSRREEILIQSIISLYNSKDNFKWIYREIGEDISTIVIGSEARSLIKNGEDPFLQVDEKHVIIVLGDLFYPKNARALVRVALPIKALDLVDKLGYVERNIVSKPVSIGYIAANVAASLLDANSTAKDISASPQDHIEFVLNKFKAPPISSDMMTPQEVLTNKADEVEFTSPPIVPSVIVDNPQGVAQKTTNKNDELNLEDFPSFKFTFPSEVAKNIPDTSETNTTISSESKDKVTYVATKEANNIEDYSEKSEISSSVHNSHDTINYNVNNKNQIIANATSDEIVSRLVEDTTAPVNCELGNPALITEVLAEHTIRYDNVVPLYNNGTKPTTIPILSEKIAQTVAEASAKPAQFINTNEQQKTELVEQSIDHVGKRIKLLRWPKSEVIERHPGNAILASMVINMPMSVEDMAKQSDLPIQICQNFMDAVVQSNVAIYVDSPEMVNQPQATTLPNEQPKVSTSEESKIKQQEGAKTTKRKGILYRIRAALGLLRK